MITKLKIYIKQKLIYSIFWGSINHFYKGFGMRTTNLNQSGLERIVVGDDVLEESLLGERFKILQTPYGASHYGTKDVQLLVEKALVKLCKERGPHPQAFILEVLDYLQNMHYPLSSISRI